MGWSVLSGEDVQIRSGNATLQAYVARPAAPGRFPAVIVLHGIFGPKKGNYRAAERYGDAGYVGLLLNWQSEENNPADAELMRYIEDAATYLRTCEFVDADRIAVVGYCSGGGRVILALEQHPWLRAGVSFHGFARYPELDEKKPRHPDEQVDRIQAPLMILHGAEDEDAPIGTIYRFAQQLDESGKTYFLRVYGGVGHAFALPDGAHYDPIAAEDAWQGSIEFLDRYLKR